MRNSQYNILKTSLKTLLQSKMGTIIQNICHIHLNQYGTDRKIKAISFDEEKQILEMERNYKSLSLQNSFKKGAGAVR